MGTQASESQGGDSTAHLHITGDHGEAQQESYTVIWSWKRPSTDGILGTSQGGGFSSGRVTKEVGTRGGNSAQS